VSHRGDPRKIRPVSITTCVADTYKLHPACRASAANGAVGFQGSGEPGDVGLIAHSPRAGIIVAPATGLPNGQAQRAERAPRAAEA
jgi:hypothetical protein